MTSKAPWHYRDGFIYDDDWQAVAKLLGGDDGPLLAAAPDLLAACERMLEAPTVTARMAAKSAIKKARVGSL